MTTFDTYILNAFEVLSTAAKATTPKDELTPEEAAEAEAEIAAENAIKAARKKALRGDYYFTFIFIIILHLFLFLFEVFSAAEKVAEAKAATDKANAEKEALRTAQRKRNTQLALKTHAVLGARWLRDSQRALPDAYFPGASVLDYCCPRPIARAAMRQLQSGLGQKTSIQKPTHFR